MKTVRLGVKQLTVSDLIQKARTLVSRMDGNEAFSTPNPSLAEITAAAAALENTYVEAQDGGKSKKIQLRQQDSELRGLIKMLAAYVQQASAGQEDLIVSSGFEVAITTNKPHPTTNPEGVRGNPTNHEGEAIIRWNGSSGAKSYVAEMSTDGKNWMPCGVATKTKMSISGLVAGSKLLFRIAAIGPLGQSGWSDPGAVWVH